MDFSEGEIYSCKVPSSQGSPIINSAFPCMPWAGSGSLCHPELGGVRPSSLVPCSTLSIWSQGVAGDSGTRASHRSQAYFVYIWFNQVVAFWPPSKLTSGWPPPCPLPAARPGNSPLNLQTNMGHIGWSNQLQTRPWKCRDVLFLWTSGLCFFCELQLYFVFGHSHLWASRLFFFFSLPFQV